MALGPWREGRPDSRSLIGAYCSSPEELILGNRIVLLHEGRQAYPAMLKAIAASKSTVHLETYILKSDETGWKFAHALADRARAAVQVRVIYDSLGSLGLDASYLQYLRNSGVQLLEYRPVAPWRRRWGWGRRDHRKILVVDGKTAFTGGINIADEYADPAEGGGGWRDFHVRIDGPAAYELERLFRSVWYRETTRWFSSMGHPDYTPGHSLVHVAANHEFLHRHRIRRAYLRAIRNAQSSISIANAYFIPDRGIRRALYRAVKRGVQVQVLLPEASDVAAVGYASHNLFETHLKHGLRLYTLPGPVLHAKTVTVDGVWSAVGSYNMDHRSWLHNLEVTINVLDEKFAAELEAVFHEDLSQSRAIGLEEWHRRPWTEKILERLFYLVRYWL